MKGIILAGGKGSRLYPMTIGTSKQMLPVFDKPMIYYPLCSLMLAGISDVLVISTPSDQDKFVALLGDGSRLGMNISYASQSSPDGLAQAFVIGQHFIGDSMCALILGDNIFYGHGFGNTLKEAGQMKEGAMIFGVNVPNPSDFGVVTLDEKNKAVSIEEKPIHPKSNMAVTGLYFYDNRVVDIAKSVEKSSRGEYEITSVNQEYMALDLLQVQVLGRGFTWFDAGTPASLMESAQYIQAVQTRQGTLIGCPEEIAWRNAWIDRNALLSSAAYHKNSEYGKYLWNLAEAGTNVHLSIN